MKVSIVTACFNSEKTIEKTLLSIDQQSWEDIQHIIVDGASKDATVDIIRKHSHARRQWISEPDQGVYDAMNKGLRLVTGDIVAFLNADDVYKSNTLIERVVRIFAAEPIEALYGNVEFFDAVDPDGVVRTYDSSRFSPDKLSSGWMPAHPSLFLRRSVFDRHGGYDPKYRIAGDFDLIARIFMQPGFRFKYCNEVFVRMQTGGLSSAGLAATVGLNREMMRACRVNGLQTNWPKLLFRYVYKIKEFF